MEVLYDCDKFSLKEILGGQKIKIPKFQRNIVWNAKKRKEFIETLRVGNPFGSILVHKINGEYILIDGLQRISTIKDYKQNPYKYFEYKDIDSEYILDLIKFSYEQKGIYYDSESAAVKNFCMEIQKFIYHLMELGIERDKIAYDVFEQFKIEKEYVTFNYITKVIDEFNKKIDIDGLIVPAIIYKGSAENLPTIFYNLNTGGVNLSKYETFSAKWNSKKFIIKDNEIIEKIVKKYEDLKKNSDLDVDVNSSEIETDGITLFEYCYSISEILRNKKYKIILGNNKKSTDPIGFEILSLILGLNVNKAENLDDKLMNADTEFLVNLKNIIVETFDVITDSLEEWIKGYNGAYNTLDSTYMLYHMAIAYIRKNYYIDCNDYTIKSIKDKSWNEKYKRYLHLYYFKDYISDFWKKNRQVSDLMREIENKDSLYRYVNNISEEKWTTALDEFKENQLAEIGTTISIKTKMFINYLTKYKIMSNQSNSQYMLSTYKGKSYKIDYEHIIPQKRIELKVKNLKDYPVSCLGNICYLSSTDNRAKKDKTLYEFTDDRPSFALNEEYLKLIDYPNKNELQFIDYNSEEFVKYYKEFISNRMNNLLNEIKDYLINE